MATGTLYTYPENFRAFKALIAAQYSNANVKISGDFVFGETNKSDGFLKKFPSGQVPAFETSDGKYLTGGSAIAYFLANDQLKGKSDLEKAQIVQWAHFAEDSISPAACSWVFPVLGVIAYNKQNLEKAREDLKSALLVLNQHLLRHTYLVGERITLADIELACTLLNVYKYVLDPNFRKSLGNVNRWFLTLVNQPQFKKVLGDVKLCDKVPDIDPKKFQQASQKPKGDKGKGGQQQPKEKPQKKEAAPAEELDEAEAILAAEPKSKDPFDAMPKGTFVMDDFKRCYSNEDEKVSIPYFWEKFDPEHYSIWYGEYSFPQELTQVFMSCNLVTGMFQRLDKMRKQAFASVCVFGENNNSSISGVWVWRGQDLAFPLSDDWQIDFESYSWKKLDPKSEETKKLVQQYFSWTGTDKDGRKFNQGKIFK